MAAQLIPPLVFSLADDAAARSEVVTEPVTLLLVGAEDALRAVLRERLSHPRWSLREARSGTDALEKLMEARSDIMLVDPRLPDLEFSEFSSIVQRQFPHVQVIPLEPAAHPAGEEGLATGRAPFNVQDLLSGGGRSLQPVSALPKFPPSRASTPVQRGWQELIGAAPAMQRVYHAAKLVARRDTTVLIQGESGTGKDLLARGIHATSAREKQPFVVINCAAIPEQLLEAELFGYTKCAFTGAAQSRIGRIHAAHGGTLFLDEIGDMPYPLQSKILRFLEQGEVQRIGGADTLKVDCRVIAATNAHLKQLVKEKLFREDLYYRLAIFPIQLPPLRERMEDLDSLVDGFLAKFCPGTRLQPAARHLLLAHDWPGNVRELRNVMERASLFAESRREIEAEDILF